MGINITKGPDEIVSGPTFNTLENAFAKVKTRNPEGLRELSMFMVENFGVDSARFVLTPAVSADIKFFGFRAFPVDTVRDSNIIDAIEDWSAHKKWYIELDRRLVDDYSHRLTAAEMALLFINYVESNMGNDSLGKRTKCLVEVIFDEDRIDWKVYRMFKSSRTVQDIATLLYVHRAYWVNYRTQLEPSSIVGSRYKEYQMYQKAIEKLINAYGTFELIDRKYEDYDRGAAGLVAVMYESINDIKYSAFRFRKNLLAYIKTTTSPYAQKCLLKVYRNFSDATGKVFVQENTALPNIPKNERTKEMIDIENANIDGYWRKYCSKVMESITTEFMDRNGFALKCNKLEVDELRVQVNDITSTDDKIFLLEKVHKNMAIVDNALAMLADKEHRHKVKQTESELKSLRDDLKLIREKIFKAPVGPTHYGLFIKYPAGYEG